ncbi:MAG TPA: VanZ family protein [Microbacteriaceae bacterium]|nr:VanZ family protein [Microbacteriaceae bacterium]
MRRVWAISALAWTAVILAITLSPEQPTDGGFVRDALAWWSERGLPAWVTYDLVEIAANVVLFIPFGLFLALALSSRPRGSSSAEGAYRDLTLRVLWPTVLGLALTLTIEFIQHAFLPARFATVSDLIANTAGALLGASLAVMNIRRRVRPQ